MIFFYYYYCYFLRKDQKKIGKSNFLEWYDDIDTASSTMYTAFIAQLCLI